MGNASANKMEGPSTNLYRPELLQLISITENMDIQLLENNNENKVEKRKLNKNKNILLAKNQ